MTPESSEKDAATTRAKREKGCGAHAGGDKIKEREKLETITKLYKKHFLSKFRESAAQPGNRCPLCTCRADASSPLWTFQSLTYIYKLTPVRTFCSIILSIYFTQSTALCVSYFYINVKTTA